MDRARQLYPSSSDCLIYFYDLRCPGATESLDLVCDGFGGSAHVEYLDAVHAMLVIRPGGALGAHR